MFVGTISGLCLFEQYLAYNLYGHKLLHGSSAVKHQARNYHFMLYAVYYVACTYMLCAPHYFRYTGTCPAHCPVLGNMRHVRTSDTALRVPFQDPHKSRCENLRQCKHYARYCCQNLETETFAILIFIFLSFLSYCTLVLSHLYYSFRMIMPKEFCNTTIVL
jgi:hypothetical protein